MKYARIDVQKEVFEAREKSVPLEMIFGGIDGCNIMYAPKSRIIVECEYKPHRATNTFIRMLVPCWVFSSKGLNPSQVATGYIECVDR
jgi:hypothetical protein